MYSNIIEIQISKITILVLYLCVYCSNIFINRIFLKFYYDYLRGERLRLYFRKSIKYTKIMLRINKIYLDA